MHIPCSQITSPVFVASDRRAVESLIKRALDVVSAALMLVLLSPLLALVGVLVKLSSRGPMLYAQTRIGFECREFRMFKFRTMVQGADAMEADLARTLPSDRTFFKLAHDPRTTAVGRLLRRSSLDELPQLYNVLLGEMSMVGPRPLLVSDFEKFPRGEQMRRFSVKPGITGLWQVSGRNRVSDERRMELDVEYVDNWHHFYDIVILARTLPAVFRGTGDC